MFKRALLLAVLAVFAGPTDLAQGGGKDIAVIDSGKTTPLTEGQQWCQFLDEHGHACTVFPKEGPTAALDPFDVVIDMSHAWSDPLGTLAECMRAGKTVITVHGAPAALGINADATVQAWIGANVGTADDSAVVTIERDPILGDIPPGTWVTHCGLSICGALEDVSGHPFAKVLARFESLRGHIGIMRNFWEGGVSVYLTQFIGPGIPLHEAIILNAVVARNPIPTLSNWGLLVMALAIGIAGVFVMRHRRLTPSEGPRGPHASVRSSTISVLLAASLLAASGTVQADVNSTREGGVTYLRLGEGTPFHQTETTVVNLRAVAIPNSGGTAVLWDEVDPREPRQAFYAISLDGKNVDEVRATSYDLQLRFAGFDPAIEAPAVPAALLADADSQLFIIQFVTQPLSEFRAAVEAQGATIYDFLPNHAYVASLTEQTRVAVTVLPFVRAVVPYHPAYRLEGFLRDNLDRAEQLFPLRRYNIRVFAAGQKNAVAARIAVLGGLVDSADAGKRMVEATLTPAQLYQVARLEEVLFIDRWYPMVPTMNNVRINGGANDLETAANYRGVGVRGEVLDLGFNLIHNAFGSSDACLPSTRLPLIQHGCEVLSGAHGASTSGIIFGNGTGNANGKGLLPCGQGIVASAIHLGQPGCASRYNHTGQLVKSEYCPTSPPDPNCPYQAVFQSASFGSGAGTDYTTISADIDDILFDFDLVLCTSQGNFGNEYYDPAYFRVSVSEAWAKNTISIGGVKHFDTQGTSDDRWCGGPDTCGSVLGSCASIGPAEDGRVKPDLAFYYDCITTVYFPGDSIYRVNFSGTSAATPMVCGYAGLLMEMWGDDSDANGRNIFRVPVPSCNPATENCVFKRRPHMTTAKAMLINTAKQYDWINGPLPNRDLDRNKQGWGVPNIAPVYDFRNNVLIVNETEVLRLFQTRSYNFAVQAGDPALRVTLVYADPPGMPGPCLPPPAVCIHTVNDLTLKVTAPNGTTHYWGNCGLRDGPDPLWSSSDCTLGDHPYLGDPTIEVIDTVENVFKQNPEPGTWMVMVRADAINQDGHVETPAMDADFALVVSSGTRTLAQCCFEDPLSCERTATCASAAACTAPGYAWFSDKTCAEVCELPGEVLCCIPIAGFCGLATADCCFGNGGSVVRTCQFCPQ